MEKNNTVMKTLRLKQEVVDKVELMAKEDNRTFTNMVETILLKANNPQFL